MLKLGEWPLLAIALSIYLIIFALVLIGVKGTELCHRQKKWVYFLCLFHWILLVYFEQIKYLKKKIRILNFEKL